MNPEKKQQWIHALRSGKYFQIRGRQIAIHDYVKCTTGHCATGVLIDLYLKDGGTEVREVTVEGEGPYEVVNKYYEQRFVSIPTGETWIDVPSASLPPEVMEWAGLTSDDPRISVTSEEWLSLSDPDAGVYRKEPQITYLNDLAALSFEQIADLIEKDGEL